MPNLSTTIESLASAFATEILTALRGASLSELVAVTHNGTPKASATPAARASASPKKAKGGRLGRRSAEDLSAMVDTIVSALQKNKGGLRSEQIRAVIGVDKKELPRPIAEALASGRITKKGEKRATTYFAAKR
jgi:hypothetical protein